jgi:hypothetical protein
MGSTFHCHTQFGGPRYCRVFILPLILFLYLLSFTRSKGTPVSFTRSKGTPGPSSLPVASHVKFRLEVVGCETGMN